MRIWAEARVLGMNRLRGKREQQRGKGRRPESDPHEARGYAVASRGPLFDQAGSETAIGARMSGTIGSSGG